MWFTTNLDVRQVALERRLQRRVAALHDVRVEVNHCRVRLQYDGVRVRFAQLLHDDELGVGAAQSELVLVLDVVTLRVCGVK